MGENEFSHFRRAIEQRMNDFDGQAQRTMHGLLDFIERRRPKLRDGEESKRQARRPARMAPAFKFTGNPKQW